MHTNDQLKKETKERLDVWSRNLIDHALNPAKAPREKLEVSFELWRQVQQEYQEDEDYLQQQYQTKHQMPRLEAKEKLQQLEDRKKELYRMWKGTKANGDLRNWLAPTYEGNVEHLLDPVYTYRTHM